MSNGERPQPPRLGHQPSAGPPASDRHQAPVWRRPIVIIPVVVAGLLSTCCIAAAAVAVLIDPPRTPHSSSGPTAGAGHAATPGIASSPVRTTAATLPAGQGTVPTSAAPPVLPFEVVQRQDVSAGSGAHRLELRVELHQWPVTLEQVTAVGTRVVESQRGQGWQALAIRVMYDRREAVPSFAALEWAPGGRWGDAASGDAATWAGYALHVATAQPKLTQPHGCTPPAEQAYQLNDEYNHVMDRDPNPDESAVLAGIADRHHLPVPTVETLVVAVETWTMC